MIKAQVSTIFHFHWKTDMQKQSVDQIGLWAQSQNSVLDKDKTFLRFTLLEEV